MIKAEQIRAGRALINSKQSEFARISGISLATLNNIERNIASPRPKTLETIRDTFDNEGVELFSDPFGVGVRLRTHDRINYRSAMNVLEHTLSALKNPSVNPIRTGVLCYSTEVLPQFFLWLDYGLRGVIFDSAFFSLLTVAKSQELAGLILAFMGTNVPLQILPEAVNVKNITAMDVIEYLKGCNKETFNTTYDLFKYFPDVDATLDDAAKQPSNLLNRLVEQYG